MTVKWMGWGGVGGKLGVMKFLQHQKGDTKGDIKIVT